MDATKRKKLEAAGWRVGSAADFLDLSEEDALTFKIIQKTELIQQTVHTDQRGHSAETD